MKLKFYGILSLCIYLGLSPLILCANEVDEDFDPIEFFRRSMLTDGVIYDNYVITLSIQYPMAGQLQVTAKYISADCDCVWIDSETLKDYGEDSQIKRKVTFRFTQADGTYVLDAGIDKGDPDVFEHFDVDAEKTRVKILKITKEAVLAKDEL